MHEEDVERIRVAPGEHAFGLRVTAGRFRMEHHLAVAHHADAPVILPGTDIDAEREHPRLADEADGAMLTMTPIVDLSPTTEIDVAQQIVGRVAERGLPRRVQAVPVAS